MTILPIDLPLLVNALAWPLAAAVMLWALRRPLAQLAMDLSSRTRKFSVGGLFSLELAELSEVKPQALEVEVRELSAGLILQSSATSISRVIDDLKRGGQAFLTIDLGSESEPRWLTSRLYLLAAIIGLAGPEIELVFVDRAGALRKRFIGTGAPDAVRWALARRYPRLETAMSSAVAVAAGAYCAAPGQMLQPPESTLQFDPEPGRIATIQGEYVMQLFLQNIRTPMPAAPPAPPPGQGFTGWIQLGDGVYEHAEWMNADLLERLLGGSLKTGSVVVGQKEPVGRQEEAILAQGGRYVALIDPDRTFRSLADRATMLESLAEAALKQAAGR